MSEGAADGAAAVGWRAWFTRDQLLALGLGQLIAVLIAGTGVASQILAEQKNVNMPTGQSFLNYFLLAVRLVVLRARQFLVDLRPHGCFDASTASEAYSFFLICRLYIVQF